MHRSRLSTFVIDCRNADLEAAAKFWSAALGRSVQPAQPEFPTYRGFEMRDDEPVVMIQNVDHDSRIHLDIEADDIEAEVKRLEALGARRIEQRRTWWIMEAPTGHRFCVVRPQRQPLDQLPSANQWEK